MITVLLLGSSGWKMTEPQGVGADAAAHVALLENEAPLIPVTCQRPTELLIDGRAIQRTYGTRIDTEAAIRGTNLI